MKTVWLVLAGMVLSCQSPKRTVVETGRVPAHAGLPAPHVLVYKTRSDYSKLVPVILSDDRTVVLSYPHPGDLRVGGALLEPAALKDGYWLDRKGIGKNTAFIRITYSEYAALPAAPDAAELLKMVVDADPFTELYDCGLWSAFDNPVKELNAMIRKNKLRQAKKIK